MSEKEFINIMKTRRSIRSYSEKTVPDDVLDTILDAATYAPTANGRQAPVIVLVRSESDRARLSALNAKIRGKDADPYYGAPVIALIFADSSIGVNTEDGTGVANYLMLAAKAYGVDSCWIAKEKEMFETDEGKAILSDWGLSDTLRGVCAVALGYAASEQPAAQPRKEGYIVKR